MSVAKLIQSVLILLSASKAYSNIIEVETNQHEYKVLRIIECSVTGADRCDYSSILIRDSEGNLNIKGIHLDGSGRDLLNQASYSEECVEGQEATMICREMHFDERGGYYLDGRIELSSDGRIFSITERGNYLKPWSRKIVLEVLKQ